MLVARIRDALASEEVLKIGQRVRREMEERSERGPPHGGPPAFG